MIRKIVHIEEEKCNGCGACAAACHEGAIAMIDGKAKLIRDDYCDGLGDCLPACPADAIRIIEREAADYDAEAVEKRMKLKKTEVSMPEGMPHVCPGSMARSLKKKQEPPVQAEKKEVPRNIGEQISRLAQWPVQIKLVPVNAPYFENAQLLIAALLLRPKEQPAGTWDKIPPIALSVFLLCEILLNLPGYFQLAHYIGG